MRDELIVVDPATGDVAATFRWRADDLFSAVAASPVVRGDRVLLAECYGPGSVLLDLSGAGIEEVRRDGPGRRPERALRSHWATPILHGDHLYGVSGRNSGDAAIVCVDWETGRVAWSTGGFGRASLTLADGHLLVLGEFGELALLKADPAACVEVSRVRPADPASGAALLEPPCWSAPVVARGLLYARGKGRLVCFELMP
jgi:outer membrane protein assembly factor BamB